VTTTVLIVDDHPSFRRFARRLLEDAGFVVLGEASDGESACATADRLRPDVVLLDVLLPDTSGVAVASALAAMPDAPAVVLISSRTEDDLGSLIADAPVRGFIPKAALTGAAVTTLLEAGAR